MLYFSQMFWSDIHTRGALEFKRVASDLGVRALFASNGRSLVLQCIKYEVYNTTLNVGAICVHTLGSVTTGVTSYDEVITDDSH